MILRTEPEALDYLRRKDPRLGSVIDRLGPLERKGNPDLFAAGVKHIIGQQISLQAQNAIWQRMKALTGEVTPEKIHEISAAELQSVGLTFRKTDYIRAFAEAILEGRLDPAELVQMEDADFLTAINRLPGIGEWTAQMMLIFSLGRQDVLSYGDYGIRKGIRMLYRYRKVDLVRFERLQRRFSPYGTTAAFYLWAIAGGAIPGLDDPGNK